LVGRSELTDKAWEQILPLCGIPHAIPERLGQRERRAELPGRPPSFDAETYARRNVVEKCATGSSSGGVATSYEKQAANYRAMVVMAGLVVWLTT
jgi:transposase